MYDSQRKLQFYEVNIEKEKNTDKLYTNSQSNIKRRIIAKRFISSELRKIYFHTNSMVGMGHRRHIMEA